jgi:hypothetical protein
MLHDLLKGVRKPPEWVYENDRNGCTKTSGIRKYQALIMGGSVGKAMSLAN